MNETSSTAKHAPPRGEFERLMMEYQRADTTAAAALVSAVSPLLYRFFLRDPESRREAADLLQDTWLRIHKSRHTYRCGEPVLPWLYAIARHVQVDAYRRRRIRVCEQPVENLPELSPGRLGGRELPTFEEIVSELPNGQREVVTMLKATGMSLDEVARATASSVDSVKQKAHRAYQNLRQILQSRADQRKTS